MPLRDVENRKLAIALKIAGLSPRASSVITGVSERWITAAMKRETKEHDNIVHYAEHHMPEIITNDIIDRVRTHGFHPYVLPKFEEFIARWKPNWDRERYNRNNT